MSVLGQKQTCALRLGMSAKGQKRTCAVQTGLSAYMPLAAPFPPTIISKVLPRAADAARRADCIQKGAQHERLTQVGQYF